MFFFVWIEFDNLDDFCFFLGGFVGIVVIYMF